VRRLLIIGLPLLALLVGGGVLIWYFAYEAETPPPRASTVTALSQPATIHWQANGTPRIEAASRADAVAALGYAHGLQRTWTLALWRQTALGQLGEWFGRGVAPLDEHARQLGLASRAETAYEQLPEATQQQLQAYTAGVNAAWADGAAARHNELVLLDVPLVDWKPWHSVAIERLVGWLATTPPADSTVASLPDSTQRFFRADDRFRQWLHLYGLDRSVAWGLSTADGPSLFQRHVFGASTLPLLQSAILDDDAGASLLGASIPGTPFFPAGRTGDTAWSILLHSPMPLNFAPVDSSALRTEYDRIRFRDGGETLLTIMRTPGRLPLSAPDSRPIRAEVLPDTLSPADSAAAMDSIRTQRRSVWQIRWPGLEAVSDAPAWMSLSRGDTGAFQLLSGHGLQLQSNGGWTVLGNPPVVARSDDKILVGQTDWARSQARSLEAQLRLDATRSPAIEMLSESDSSTWAARGTRSAMPFLLMPSSEDSLVREATTYLRNWDYAYDRASIGASVFETWLRTHRTETDSLPFIPPRAPLTPPDDSLARVQWADSLRADSLRRGEVLQSTLVQAVQSLSEQYGRDLRRWRWERVNAMPRYFPVWSADSIIARDLRGLSETRYAPIERPGRGHPSTLSSGTSLLDAAPRPAAAWEGWTTLAADAPFMIRRPEVRTDVFLGRYTAPSYRLPAARLRSDTTALARTQLRPAQ
jgi:hypothetical protein